MSSLPQDYVEEIQDMIDASMDRHVKTSTYISASLGFTLLALYIEGLMRLLGVIPPFMGIDINVMS
jgi:hypothetical protein|tara:strand:- start:89 stop:286 length:198 start_codon:yes stop_codon:yes gene_type:complete